MLMVIQITQSRHPIRVADEKNVLVPCDVGIKKSSTFKKKYEKITMNTAVYQICS